MVIAYAEVHGGNVYRMENTVTKEIILTSYQSEAYNIS